MSQRITAYLRSLKDRKGYTQQLISDETGVPIGTIGKYFSGVDDESASFEIVRKLVVLLGGTLDELACIDHGESAYMAVVAGARIDEKDERSETFVRVLEGYEQQFDREREAYDAQLRTKDRWIRALAVALGVIIATILALLVADMLTPHIGWFKR